MAEVGTIVKRAVDAVAALRIGRCGIRADTMWDGRPARGDGVVVAAEATWEKRMMLDDLDVQSNCSIERYKARFVELGNRRVYGESYD